MLDPDLASDSAAPHFEERGRCAAVEGSSSQRVDKPRTSKRAKRDRRSDVVRGDELLLDTMKVEYQRRVAMLRTAGELPHIDYQRLQDLAQWLTIGECEEVASIAGVVADAGERTLALVRAAGAAIDQKFKVFDFPACVKTEHALNIGMRPAPNTKSPIRELCVAWMSKQEIEDTISQAWSIPLINGEPVKNRVGLASKILQRRQADKYRAARSLLARHRSGDRDVRERQARIQEFNDRQSELLTMRLQEAMREVYAQVRSLSEWETTCLFDRIEHDEYFDDNDRNAARWDRRVDSPYVAHLLYRAMEHYGIEVVEAAA